MPVDLAELCDPDHTAVVTQECQVGVIGPGAPFRDLAVAASTTVVPNGARLLRAARAAGVAVLHCLMVERADGQGANHNARLFAAARTAGVDITEGGPGAAVVAEFGPDDRDLVLLRHHGVGPMGGTDLDPVLRNLGVTTIVGVGVSLNVGIASLALDAVNAGYQMVIPTDAVAGVPADYGDAVLANTLSVVATLITTDDLVATWSRR